MTDPRDTGAPNLAPNEPLFQGLVQVAAADAEGRLVIPLAFKEFSEGAVLILTHRPTLETDPATLAVVAQFIINSRMGAQQQIQTLDQCQILLPGASYAHVVPAWLSRITIDARGVQADDLTTRADIELQAVVYSMDRMTRQQWKGAGKSGGR